MSDQPDVQDLHDQLVDQALREQLGNEGPPPIAEAILARCAEEMPVVSSYGAKETAPRRLRRVLSWAVAASVLLGVGLIAWPALDSARESAEFDRVGQETPVSGQPVGTPQESLKRGKLDFEAANNESTGLSTFEELGDKLATKPNKEIEFQRMLEGQRRQFGHDQQEEGSTLHNMEASDRNGNVPLEDAVFGVDAIFTFGTESSEKQSQGPPSSPGRGLVLGVPVQPITPRPEVAQEWGGSTKSSAEGSYFAYGVEQEALGKAPATDGFAFNKRPESLELQKQWHWNEKATREGQGPGRSGDKYERIYENAFIKAEGLSAVSTLSIDVDTASYANVRQFLTSGQLPPPDAVRLEELINYFDYQYEGPSTNDSTPFAAHVEVAGCPWAAEHRLVRIGVKGRELQADKRPLSNLVFLIDVSGSMQDASKLPLVIEGMKALTRQLGENDRISIVVYASSEGLVLESTPGDQQETILAALDGLRAGGSTAGGAGIRLAYQLAEDHFIQGGCNRVILCTDGDFNVGTTSTGDLERLVADKAKQTGVFLSVCGFGRGNLNDAMMETVSNKGNGAYYYIDTQKEAERVFVKGLTGTLVTIAKDVKIQVEFNPAQVAGYRLLGYENRLLEAQDFNDDKKDAGEIGAGHTVTALYEVVPAGKQVPAAAIDELKYQQQPAAAAVDETSEMLTLKMRYKLPEEDTSTKREWPVTDNGQQFGAASDDFQFASAVAGFGMLLRGSQHAGNLTWDAVREIAQGGASWDPSGDRAEFLTLVDKAKQLAPQPKPDEASTR